MRGLPAALLFAALSGCDNPFGLGGQDLEGDPTLDAAPESDSDTDAAAAGVLGDVEASCFDTGGPMDRTLTAFGGEGTIDVQDAGLQEQCCAEFRVDASIVGARRLEIAYTDEAVEPCDCSCPWLLSYSVGPLEPGDWTVVVGAIEAPATVR